MNDEEYVWLIDSSIYVFKAWFTRPEEFDNSGNSINAVKGFIAFIYKVMSNERPSKIAFAFDESLETSHRRDIYPEYKANRTTAPDSLKLQFRLCRDFLTAIGIHQQASKFYEADDLIGTWAKSLNEINVPVNIISADKDLAQLVKTNDFWWEYERGEKFDAKKIEKKFKVKPHQIADQLAIAGDKSDNIPGVPGIGMATAAKLIKRFENLENLFANTEKISSMNLRGASRLQTLIESHIEIIKLARKLTQIECDIEEIDRNVFKIGSMDLIAFHSLSEQLKLSLKQQNLWIELLHTLRRE